MLPAYIIEDIRRRDWEREQLDEMVIECPEIPISDDDRDPTDEDIPKRGIVILDFTI